MKTPSEVDFDPPLNNVGRSAAIGVASTGFSQLIKIATQFLSVIILARLLPPSDFGVIAKVTPIYNFALLFHDIGLSQATIQKRGLRHEEVNTFFWINVAIGSAITLTLVATSPLVGSFYHDPRAIGLTAAMACLIFVNGLGNQHGALMTRRLAFRSQTICSIVGAITSLVAGVSFAVYFRSYWALYISLLVGTVVPTALAWAVEKWRPTAPRIAKDTMAMIKYGAGITGGNFVNFIVSNTASVAIGRTLGDKPLGLYDRSSRLLSAPLQQVIWPLSGVVIPILYRLHDDDNRYRAVFLRALECILLALTAGVIWVAIASKGVVALALGSNWLQASPVFAALSIAALPQLVNGCANWLIMTQGRSRDYAYWGLIGGAITLSTLFIGLRYGIIGVAVAAVAAEIIRTPIYWWFACSRGPVRANDVFKTLLPYIFAAAPAAVATLTVQNLLAHLPLILILIAGLATSHVVFLTSLAAFPKSRATLVRELRFAFRMTSQLFRQGRAH